MVISTEDIAKPTFAGKLGSHIREYWWIHLLATVPGIISTIALYTFLTLAFIEAFG